MSDSIRSSAAPQCLRLCGTMSIEWSEAELTGHFEHHHSEEEPDAPAPCHQRRRSDESVQPGLGGARVAVESMILQYHQEREAEGPPDGGANDNHG